MANLRATIRDLGGFDSGRILSLRGAILMHMGDFPEGLSQQILAGMILLGRLGVLEIEQRIAAFFAKQPAPRSPYQ